MDNLKKYRYKGPVLMFKKMMTDNWSGETVAPTKERALSNLQYQFKKQNGFLASAARVELPGSLAVTFEY